MLDRHRSKRTAGISELVRAIGFVIVALAASVSTTFAQERSIVVASTTSTQDSGLFGYLLPIFKAKTGIDVKVVAQGTGQALDTARRGDADVVFVHAKPEEEKFVAGGGAEGVLGKSAPVRVARRSLRHPSGGTGAMARCRYRHRQEQGGVVSRHRP